MCKKSFVTVCIRSTKHKLFLDDMLAVHTGVRRKRPTPPPYESPTEAEDENRIQPTSVTL